MAKVKKQVAVIMGSDSDLKIMKDAVKVLKEFKISHEVLVVSAHRTPEGMVEFAKTAARKKIEVIIAGAGGAAHLPGLVASLTTLPVIGVPVQTTALKGLDSLLSIVQMPKGIPVATMAVDNATNAGLMAVRILALKDQKLQKKLENFSKSQRKLVDEMNRRLKT